jgi:ABC-2 type transport system permease protein
MNRELKFLLALWQANLLSAMEFRASFISQTVGMMLNNAIYFLFWVIFFDRFKEVRGWGLNEMFLLYGLVAGGFGLCNLLFGNLTFIAEFVANGRLDYYLSLPRPVLLHVLASRSNPSGLGDFLYGVISFFFAGQFEMNALLRYGLGMLLSMIIFLSFMILVQSLAFWVGNAQMFTAQALNAVITFSIYPITLFDGSAKLILFTVIPAALIGALPAEFTLRFTPDRLIELLGAASLFLFLAVILFYRGLRRYESGSAIQTQG